MSAEFPTLAEVHAEHQPAPFPSSCCRCGVDLADGEHRADRWDIAHGEHVEQAWREACTIRTVEQLDALPDGAIVADCNRHPVYKRDGIWWSGSQRASIAPPYGFPALLLWHPDWATS